eukprot:g2248.t1
MCFNHLIVRAKASDGRVDDVQSFSKHLDSARSKKRRRSLCVDVDAEEMEAYYYNLHYLQRQKRRKNTNSSIENKSDNDEELFFHYKRLEQSYSVVYASKKRGTRRALLEYVKMIHSIKKWTANDKDGCTIFREYKMNVEVFFRAVDILDRYLSKTIWLGMSPKKLKIVAATSLWIALKIEDGDHLESTFFKRAISEVLWENVLKTEIEVLETLKYDVAQPTAMTFLNILLEHMRLACSDGARKIAVSLCVISVRDLRALHFEPSKLASSCLFVALKIVTSSKDGTILGSSVRHDYLKGVAPTLYRVSGYARTDLRSCVREVFRGVRVIMRKALKKKERRGK